MSELNLENTSQFSRPIWATEKDLKIGEDELGNPRFRGQGGREYTISPAPRSSRPEGGYVRAALGAVKDMPPVADWDFEKLGPEMAKGAKAVAEALWGIVQTPGQVLSGEKSPTIGDAVDVAGFAATGGMGAGALGAVPEGALVANVPMYKPRQKTSETSVETAPKKLDPFDEPINWSEFNATPPDEAFNNLTYRDWNNFIEDDSFAYEFLSEHNIPVTFDTQGFLLSQVYNERLQNTAMGRFLGGGMFDDDFIQGKGFLKGDPRSIAEFRSPVREVLDDLEIPSKGLKGSQFLKELQDNPTIRNSEVTSLDLQIDPMKRYTKEELASIVDENIFTTQALGAGPRYRTMQRQPVSDPELDYEEIIVNAARKDGKPMFEPKYGTTHYNPNTIAHARVSVRDGDQGKYILVEEMQSDLLQQGYRKPASNKDFDSIRGVHPLLKDMSDKEIRVFTRNVSPLFDMEYLGDVYRKKHPEAFRWSDSIETHVLTPEGHKGFNEFADSLYSFYKKGTNKLMFEPDYFSEVGAPPIASTTESTRAIVQSIMAYADKSNVSEIVFPPLERIAAQRFKPGTEGYEKAIKPGSGFHQTYVTSLNKVLDEIKRELGDNAVQVDRKPINYPEQSSRAELTDIEFGAVNRDWSFISTARSRARNSGQTLEEYLSSTAPRRADMEDLTSLYGTSWITAESPEVLEELIISRRSAKKVLPAEGISIRIPTQQEIDFSRPRFNKGGLVTRTRQAFGEIE
jgi:hypothetical protein